MRYIVHRLELGVGGRELPEKFVKRWRDITGRIAFRRQSCGIGLEAERKKVTGRRSERAAIRGQG